MIRSLLLTAIIIVLTLTSNAQNIQGSLRLGSEPTKLIMLIRNNGSATLTGNLTELRFTLGLGISLDTHEETFLPAVNETVSDSLYWNFGEKSTITWRGNLPIALAPGQTLDMIEFIVTDPMTRQAGPSGVQLMAGLIEQTHIWSVKMNGIQAADQVNRFFNSGDIYYLTNHEISSTASIHFELTALPVKLISFSVESELDHALLSWATAEEVNSRHFEIERSSDAAHWLKIGVVTSTGESNTQRKYTFTDTDPSAGNNYYRLKMVDNDNTFAYSKIVVMRSEKSSGVYPNPTKGIVTLQDVDAKTVDVLNMEGNVVKRNVPVKNNQIDLSKLQRGLYILKVKDASAQERVLRIVID